MKKTHEISIEQVQKELEEWKGKYLRALADYQNLEKRISQDRQEQEKYASGKVIHEMLTVFDTLEKAQKHLKDPGLSLGVKGFWEVLKRFGVQKIEVYGKKFDPIHMECTEVVESDRDDEIVEEVRPGYSLHSKVLRVARVKVGKKKTEHKEDNVIN